MIRPRVLRERESETSTTKIFERLRERTVRDRAVAGRRDEESEE